MQALNHEANLRVACQNTNQQSLHPQGKIIPLNDTKLTYTHLLGFKYLTLTTQQTCVCLRKRLWLCSPKVLSLVQSVQWHQTNQCRYTYGPGSETLRLDSGLHHKPNDSNPVLTNDGPWPAQRARSGRCFQPLSALKKDRKLLTMCLKCMAQLMWTINRPVLISDLLRDVSFKSCLSWEIHTNVVWANDRQMAGAAGGYEADTICRQTDERSLI